MRYLPVVLLCSSMYAAHVDVIEEIVCKVNGDIITRNDLDKARKQAEEEVLAQRRLLQTVFDTLPVHLVVKDAETRYLMVNRAWCERYGLSPEQVVGRRIAELPGRPEKDQRNTER